ncbi:hypothetical protein PHMEG_00034371 [Phytophthora megakarya]|uniref:Uncharacterized protein n=1 Tax=Phytophthora megakarya TaxID=4795 RepID=A0A225URM8_9STRA|nr:hypothetical protein PHMEG_00034371 [Phytophthora megakarya]
MTTNPTFGAHLVPEQDDPTDQNWTNDGEEDDNEDEEDEDDDLLDGSPSRNARAKTKRRRIMPAEMKNPAKRQHQRKLVPCWPSKNT